MNEILEARTRTAKTFDLGGRRKRLVVNTSNIHYKDDEGKLQDIDCSVEDGRVCRCDYDVSLLDGKVGYAGTDPKGKRIELELLDAQAEPIIEGNVVTYSDAQEACDVVLTFLPGGIRFNRVLKDASALKGVRFRSLREEGALGRLLNLGADSKGRKTQLSVSEEPSTASVGERIISQEWTGKVAKMDKETRKRVWVEDVAYPVTIDPTSTFTIAANADDGQAAEIGVGATTTTITNNPVHTPLTTLLGNVAWVGSNYYAPDEQYACWLRFSGITIPEGSTINSASLKPYTRVAAVAAPFSLVWLNDTRSNPNNPANAQDVFGPTNKSTIISNNYTATAGFSQKTIDVKSEIESLLSSYGGYDNQAMAFYSRVKVWQTGTYAFNIVAIGQREGTQGAELVIDYDAPSPGRAPDKTTIHHG